MKGTALPTNGARGIAIRQKSARAASVMGSRLGLLIIVLAPEFNGEDRARGAFGLWTKFNTLLL